MPLFLCLLLVFLVGAGVGSFLHVCVTRIPLEKSILWPGPRCTACLQPIGFWRNLPLLGAKQRCPSCGVGLSARRVLVELTTGLLFAGLFYCETAENTLNLPALQPVQQAIAQTGFASIDLGLIPAAGWFYLAYHATLVAFLLVASFCDLASMEIPLSVTIAGTVVGLVGGTLLWSALPASATLPPGFPLVGVPQLEGRTGVYPWPVWTELPDWLGPTCLLTGLATGLAGMVAGMVLLRAVRFLFGVGRGVEGLGVGDADLMMMAGSFIGWQPVVMALFIAVFPALVFGIIQLLLRGDQMLPFGPSLAAGVVLTLLAWQSIGPRFAWVFFNGSVLLILVVAGAVFMLLASFLLRLIRR